MPARVGGGAGEQGEVEGPTAYVAAVHVQGAVRVPGGVACLAKVAEALCHAGGQVRLVESRVVLAGGAIDNALDKLVSLGVAEMVTDKPRPAALAPAPDVVGDPSVSAEAVPGAA